MMQKPRLAATVILLRGRERGGFEVFLTRRPETMSFLGGMYCFPGGALMPQDYVEATLRRVAGITPRQAQKEIGAAVSPRQALGLWVAGARELFEEVGVLLAVDSAGSRPVFDPAMNARLEEKRASLLSGSLSFRCCLESENLFCDGSGLVHFSHWQTPPGIATRFDTHFFLAALPADQSPLASSPEVTDSLWTTPDEALTMFGQNALPLIFPTFAALRTLADFDTLESVLSEYRTTPP